MELKKDNEERWLCWLLDGKKMMVLGEQRRERKNKIEAPPYGIRE